MPSGDGCTGDCRLQDPDPCDLGLCTKRAIGGDIVAVSARENPGDGILVEQTVRTTSSPNSLVRVYVGTGVNDVSGRPTASRSVPSVDVRPTTVSHRLRTESSWLLCWSPRASCWRPRQGPNLWPSACSTACYPASTQGCCRGLDAATERQVAIPLLQFHENRPGNPSGRSARRSIGGNSPRIA
jgi:hypothetical protein